MKEMEAKTENRYEYRKPQEKRKQMIEPDLFEFAYDIVNITLHFFLKDVRSMLPPAVNHSIAVS